MTKVITLLLLLMWTGLVAGAFAVTSTLYCDCEATLDEAIGCKGRIALKPESVDWMRSALGDA